jgi:SAM-dependent methyltransferase
MLPIGLPVLDLGCGSGEDLPEFQRRGVPVVGLDVSSGLLAVAAGHTHAAGRLILGDMRQLPLANACLGGVWADGSLHHLAKRDIVPVFNEVNRLLVSLGCFAFSVERGSGEGFVTDTEVEGPRWYSRFELDELKGALLSTRFQVVDHLIGEPSGYSPGGFIVLFAHKL